MRTLAAGSKRLLASGFTLLELLVVMALIAVATAGVSLSLPGSADSALERDAERLAALLETGRAQARANGSAVVWRVTAQGDSQSFVFDGLPLLSMPRHWLGSSTQAAPNTAITLSSSTRPERPLWVVTDGLRPFRVQNSPQWMQP
jgi:general secretion pathway protein H